jgi:hypothetical protein
MHIAETPTNLAYQTPESGNPDTPRPIFVPEPEQPNLSTRTNGDVNIADLETMERELGEEHPAFRNPPLNEDRCTDSNFWVDEKQAHRALAESCIRLMSTALKQDICDQHTPGVLVTNVESRKVEQSLPPDVQYACLYWVQHLQRSGIRLRDDDQVHQFLQAHFLHWLEALSWMRKISEGILAIISLESIALVSVSEYITRYSTNLPFRLGIV